MSIERCNACFPALATGVIVPECIPVPWFGALTDRVAVATIGLNPALDEWNDGKQWRPVEQRLSMPGDFGAADRGTLTEGHLRQVQARRTAYFNNRPHPYFASLESLMLCVNPAWNYREGTAIHIDLVACATSKRWGLIPPDAKRLLKANCREYFLHTLRRLPFGTIFLLNGRPVRDGLIEAGAAADADSAVTANCSIPDAPQETGFAGQFVVEGSSRRYLGWSTPLKQTTGPVALAIALWVRRMMATSLP